MTKRSFSTLAERIEWLVKHPQYLEAWDDSLRQKSSEAIVLAMQEDGLVSRNTFWPDVNLKEAVHQAKLRYYHEHPHD